MARDWNEGGLPVRSRPLSATEVAPSVLADISRVMRDVVAHDARHNPNAIGQLDKVMPAGAVPVTDGVSLTPGWAKEIPIGPVVAPGSLAERVMGEMIDAALPPGRPKGVEKG